VTSSVAGQINGPLFASSKKSNRFSSGISYDYRSSDRRCDTVQWQQIPLWDYKQLALSR